MRFISNAMLRALGFSAVSLAMVSGALAKPLPDPRTCFTNTVSIWQRWPADLWPMYGRCFSANDAYSCWIAKAHLDGRPGLPTSDHGKGCQYVWAMQGLEAEETAWDFLIWKDRARAHVDVAIKNRPDLPGGYHYLAKLLFKDKRLDAAMKAVKLALELEFPPHSVVSRTKVLALQAHIQESMDLEAFERDVQRSRNRDYFQNIGLDD